MASDDQTPLADLKSWVAAFAKERDWDQFHSPKNLTMALAAEVGELMELFQWKTELRRVLVPRLSARLAKAPGTG